MLSGAACLGCGVQDPTFQCPLCVSQGLAGLFCSQLCFAKNFVKHRDAVHGTVVRDKTAKIEKKRAVKAQEIQLQEAHQKDIQDWERKRVQLPLFPVFFSESNDIVSSLLEAVRPPLDFAKLAQSPVVISTPYKDIFQALFPCAAFLTGLLSHEERVRVQVLCGSALSASLVCWAAKCCRLTPVSLHNEGESKVQIRFGNEGPSKVSVVMPDCSADGEITFTLSSKKQGTHTFHPPPIPHLDLKSFQSLQVSDSLFLPECAPFAVSMWLNRDLESTLQKALSLFMREGSTKTEHALFTILLFNRGGDDPTLHHNLLAHMLWRAVVLHRDQDPCNIRDRANVSGSFAQTVARCVLRVARHLPPLLSGSPNVSLEAILCFVFPHLPLSMIDGLAACWGFLPFDFDNPSKRSKAFTNKVGTAQTGGKLVAGPVSIRKFDRLRPGAVHNISMRFGAKLGANGIGFLVVLMHHLYDFCQKHVCSVTDLKTATCWSPFFETSEVGDLESFLFLCGLLDQRDGKSILSRTTPKKGVDRHVPIDPHTTFVKPNPDQKFVALPRKVLPFGEVKLRQTEDMHVAAVDEILSVMPSSNTVPIFIGDVGQEIGIWSKFNARFGGKLGLSLMEFMNLHPEAFKVVGNIVRRVDSSASGRIRIRYEDRPGDSDDEDRPTKKKNKSEGRGAKTSKATLAKRGGLARAESQLMASTTMTKRAKKKQLRKLRNAAKFNKNRKTLDPSAKVKGYVKPKARKISGRGKKKNLKTAGKR